MQGRKTIEVFTTFLKLGLTSFGGPIAHLGYFHREIVLRRKWLDAEAYADLVALCQFLPGPASSQTGIGIGLSRAGYGGAVAAWLGFTLPSACAMILCAYGMTALASLDRGWLHGLKIAVAAVILQAIRMMTQRLAPDTSRIFLMLLSAAICIFSPSVMGQVTAIAFGGTCGLFLLKKNDGPSSSELPHAVSRPVALSCLFVFSALLVVLPFLAGLFPQMQVFDSFYRVGALVFGGGHVVLPLLQAEMTAHAWVAKDAFVAGYGALQAMPGPLFTFAAYLGTLMNGIAGALLCLAAIFLPSFLLVIGAFPYWAALRRYAAAQAAMRGVNAAVTGLLLAAFYNPVLTTTVTNSEDLLLVAGAYALLDMWKLPSWLLVGICAAAGALIA